MSPKNKQKRKTPIKADPLKIFRQAERFRHASDLLFRHVFRNEKEALVSIPAVVCQAMAVELYLKCLASLDSGHFYPEHNLEQLFADLSPSTQSRLVALHEIWSSRSGDAAMREADRAERPNLKHDLLSCLIDGSEAFVDIRYLFGEKPLRTKRIALTAPCRAATKLVQELKPAWARYQMGVLVLEQDPKLKPNIKTVRAS